MGQTSKRDHWVEEWDQCLNTIESILDEYDQSLGRLSASKNHQDGKDNSDDLEQLLGDISLESILSGTDSPTVVADLYTVLKDLVKLLTDRIEELIGYLKAIESMLTSLTNTTNPDVPAASPRGKATRFIIKLVRDVYEIYRPFFETNKKIKKIVEVYLSFIHK